ncbi:MAG: lipid-A-disaccharide synthase N-terminal domain-containing protein [Waddliaceae bacterium]
MDDSLRVVLYPLGLCAQILFGGRVIYQWILSEANGKSYVTKGFWQLSILGNLSLMIHAFIQLQFHLFLTQVGGAFISWRNLNLMSDKRYSAKQTIFLLFLTLSCCTGIYWMTSTEWFRIPSSLWHQPSRAVGWPWHMLGVIGMTLFASRFWVQWWQAEKNQTSLLTPLFFWISGAGSILTLVYFVYIQDFINVTGPLLSLVPYARNLILLSREKSA